MSNDYFIPVILDEKYCDNGATMEWKIQFLLIFYAKLFCISAKNTSWPFSM